MSQPYLCPVDQTPLVMSERQGVEIDYCPSCRGVWLDRGELDKIIEKNETARQSQTTSGQQSGQWAGEQQYSEHYGHGRKPYKRRKSFLEELFD